jgi:Rieske Fe-S protein
MMLLLWMLAAAPVAYAQVDRVVALACQPCHPTEGEEFSRSVHAKGDFDCRQCHGGEEVYAMPEANAAVYTRQTAPPASRPAFDHGTKFRGKPSRLDVPPLCGDCHANVARMNPYGLRTDQLAQYKTSQHGIRLFTAQDTRVAVCIDCHGKHAVLAPSDPSSSVNALSVPGTCGRCHGDAEVMGKYDIPSQIVAQYKQSVHGRGLLEGHDAGMPTCATCHGNHGAQPPGFRDIGHVCAKCHQQTADYFNLSVHSRFSRLPACVECHAASGDPLDHRIFKATRSPEELARDVAPAYKALMARGADSREVDAVLMREIVRADSPPDVPRLGSICQRCHRPSFETGHRFFFAQLDVEAVGKGARLDEAIRRAQLEYVKAGARIDEVGSGEVLVQDEAMLLDQARTNLVSLLAVQHTLDEQKIFGVAGAVIETSHQIEASLDLKEASLALRHHLLLPVWGFIVLLAGALLVKHRRLKHALVVPVTAAPPVAVAYHEPPDRMTRRSFLDWLLAGGGAVVGASMIGPAIAYVWPSTQRGPVQQRVEVGAVDTWEPWTGKAVAVNEKPVLVVRMGQQFRAYSAVCTHLGCLVHWEAQKKEFLCPCHAGTFDQSGKVVSGPPPKGLTEFAATVVQGKVYVSL